MIKLKIFFAVCLCITALYGCSIFKSNKTVRAVATTGPVTENISVYTESLKCLGKQITETNQAFKVKASVGLIQDKTGKKEGFGFPLLTQSASEMALTALARTNAIKIVATTDTKDMLQYNLLGRKTLTESQLALINMGNVGSTLTSDFFITGSISEYNDNLRTNNKGINFFRKLLDTSFSTEDKVITIAMDLRIVGPTTGSVLTNEKRELLITSLQNSVVTRNYEGSFFRVFSDSGAGIDYAVKISDPRHLAVREIIEKGVLMLIGKLYDVPWKQCDVATTPENVAIGGSLARYLEKSDRFQAQKALETARTNKIVKWKNSSVVQYTMKPTKTYRDDGKLCREYDITIIQNDNSKEVKQVSKGTACRQPYGVWKDIDLL